MSHRGNIVRPRYRDEAFFNQRKEIKHITVMKDKQVLQLQLPEWLQNLAFVEGITRHLDNYAKWCEANKNVRINICRHPRVHVEADLLGDKNCQLRNCLFSRINIVFAVANNIHTNLYTNKITGLQKHLSNGFKFSKNLCIKNSLIFKCYSLL